MLSRIASNTLRTRSVLPLVKCGPVACFSSSSNASASTKGVSEFGQQHVAHGLSGRLSQAVIQSGKGTYITLNDERGEYLDFTSGIGVTSLGSFTSRLLEIPIFLNSSSLVSSWDFIISGHSHPKVSQAAADQCFNIVHAQVSFRIHPCRDLGNHFVANH